MFNNTVNNLNSYSTIQTQACPGGIYKSHPKSRIISFQHGSTLAKQMLSVDYPKIGTQAIVVLQVVNSIDNYVLVEYMYEKDYDAETICFNSNGSSET